jgi:hypothetical protein
MPPPWDRLPPLPPRRFSLGERATLLAIAVVTFAWFGFAAIGLGRALAHWLPQ